MAATIDAPARCEVRSVIRFLQAEGCSAADIHRRMSKVYGERFMSEGSVREWCRKFNDGRTDVHDKGGQGRKSVAAVGLVQHVDQVVRAKRRFTINQLSEEFPDISRSALYTIVRDLGYRKLCARWVPKMLSDAHKTQRMGSALTFLTRYHDEGEKFLTSIVTGDETWVLYDTPETKEQSRQWMHTDSPRKPRKFKQTLSRRKTMATVFWDHKGVLLVDFLQQGTTITKEVYCDTLRRLRRAIQNKRRGMLSSGVVLIHDNARPHCAKVSTDLLKQFKWEVFEHPPYSPDLAPSDFYLFRHLKVWLGGQRFTDNDELQHAVQTYLSSLAAHFFEEGFEKLVSRYDKCLNLFGDYVEK